MTSGAIDCEIQIGWRSTLEVFEYLPEGWREYVYSHLARPWREYALGLAEKPDGNLNASPMSLDPGYYNPLGDYLPGSLAPDTVTATSDPGLLREQHLEPTQIEAGLLIHSTTAGAVIPAHGVVKLSIELVRAINDLTIDRWLVDDNGLVGTILVPTQVPEAAAAEIRRIGQHPRVAAVQLGVSALARPFGHPSYWPIFEAAHELELPIVIQAGADHNVEDPAFAAAGGLPGTFAETRVLGAQTLMTHAASLIGQGVMFRYPSLRFLLLGGSVSWITPFLWRYDTDFRAFRHDLAFLKGLPSEVFHQYFCVGTFPFCFEAAGDQLARYLSVDHHLEDVICYSSGYPDREYVGPSDVVAALPPEWETKVLRTNGLRFLGARAPAHKSTTAAAGRE